jgi:DNA-binding transcriptional MerR regulator
MPESSLLIEFLLVWAGRPCRSILGAIVGRESMIISTVDSPLRGECTMNGMPSHFAIGDFSRATHLTIKTLRHYHQAGLLDPAHFDSQTGYRRYTAEQISIAQIIRRFRTLEMPITEIRAVLEAPDVQTRNKLIAAQQLEARPRYSFHATQVFETSAALCRFTCRPSSSLPSYTLVHTRTSILPTVHWLRMYRSIRLPLKHTPFLKPPNRQRSLLS